MAVEGTTRSAEILDKYSITKGLKGTDYFLTLKDGEDIWRLNVTLDTYKNAIPNYITIVQDVISDTSKGKSESKEIQIVLDEKGNMYLKAKADVDIPTD